MIIITLMMITGVSDKFTNYITDEILKQMCNSYATIQLSIYPDDVRKLHLPVIITINDYDEQQRRLISSDSTSDVKITNLHQLFYLIKQ
ncbi:hypothetical protein DERP_001294 [Dermatophagoides pteronyssinus]|uniref:Uncharacterized protein n=1 Tax=Dermatophagoides pteronyssinus TaxID=6956 RepID=A0ABQ8JE33_DERPT|nr:hypothetical protein DERP_001294 [Dermatophagoides pteronyssinus]